MSRPDKWRTLRDGGSGQWLYIRHIGGRRYQIIDITDMWDACGRDAEDSPQYCGELKLVDLDALDDSTIDGAKECCDFDSWFTRRTDGMDIADVETSLKDGMSLYCYALAECCADYGAASPLDQTMRKGHVVATREMKRSANAYLGDALEERLDTHVVNKIGSTAREFGSGDLTSAMIRGVEAGDPSARLMAKIHGIPQDAIDNVRPVYWLPYFIGYQDAMAGAPAYHRSEAHEREPASPEYGRGYERGERVKAGKVPPPDWIGGVTRAPDGEIKESNDAGS